MGGGEDHKLKISKPKVPRKIFGLIYTHQEKIHSR